MLNLIRFRADVGQVGGADIRLLLCDGVEEVPPEEVEADTAPAPQFVERSDVENEAPSKVGP